MTISSCILHFKVYLNHLAGQVAEVITNVVISTMRNLRQADLTKGGNI